MHRLFGGAAARRTWLITIGVLLGAVAGVLITLAVTGPSAADHRPPAGEPAVRVSTTVPAPSTATSTPSATTQPVPSSAEPVPAEDAPVDVEPADDQPAPPAPTQPAPPQTAPAGTTSAPTATPCLEGEYSPDCLDDGLHNGSA